MSGLVYNGELGWTRLGSPEIGTVARCTARPIQDVTLCDESRVLHRDVEFALTGHGVSGRRVSPQGHNGYHRENDSHDDHWHNELLHFVIQSMSTCLLKAVASSHSEYYAMS